MANNRKDCAPQQAAGSSTNPSFDLLPDSAFVRAAQLANNSKRPPAPVPLPFSEPTLWRMVKAGQFPAPVKLGPMITAWNVGKVREWMRAQQAAEVA